MNRQHLLLLAARILPRIDLLVVHELDPAVKRAGSEATYQRAQPVDPVVVREVAGHDGGAEAAGGIEGAAGEVDA